MTEDKYEKESDQAPKTEKDGENDGSVKIGGVFNIILRPGLAYRRRKTSDVIDATREVDEE